MTDKDRRKLKKSIKDTLNKADHMIQLANIGKELGVDEEPEESTEGREMIVSELVYLKIKLSDDIEKIIAEIDEAIIEMS